MAVMCVLLPATLHATRTELHMNESELTLSRITSCIMLLAYAAYIYFQLSSPPKLREEVREYFNAKSICYYPHFYFQSAQVGLICWAVGIIVHKCTSHSSHSRPFFR